MKKQLLFTFMISLCVLANAQNSFDRILNKKNLKAIRVEGFMVQKAPSIELKSALALREPEFTIYQSYDEGTDSYMPYRKVVEKKDAAGNIILKEDYFWENDEWVGGNKYEYAYDDNGNQILNSYYYWSSGWIGQYKTEEAYDANGNFTLYQSSEWDNTSNSWVYRGKEEYTYNEDNNYTLQQNSEWDGTAWVATFKGEYLFNPDGTYKKASYYEKVDGAWVVDFIYDDIESDANGIPTLYIAYELEEGTSLLVKKEKYEITIDSEGRPTSEVEYEWDTAANDWVFASKTTTTYNFEGRGIEESLVSEWVEGAWVNVEKNYYGEDEFENLIHSEHYYWTDGEWVGSGGYYVCDYDINGNITLEEYYNWDSTDKEWDGSGKDEFTNDEDGEVVVEVSYTWDDVSDSWVGDEKSETINDISYSYGWSGSAWVEARRMKPEVTYLPTGEKDEVLILMSTDGGDTWANNMKLVYGYSHTPAALEAITMADISISPNPARTYINLDFTNNYSGSIELISISGSVVKQIMVGNVSTQVINVSELQSGFYIVKVGDRKQLLIVK